VLESTDSTNEEARRLAAQGIPEGAVVLADSQVAGRGRLGRVWHSASGLGLYMSVLFRPLRPLREVTRWTLAASLAACEAAREVSEREITIKWPNDLLWNGLKVAGILAELRSLGSAPLELVLGTGFNVNHLEEDFPPELRLRAASLRMARAGASVEREALAAAYLRHLHEAAQRLAAGEWDEIAERWMRLAPGAEGRRVCVVSVSVDGEESRVRGITRGIDSQGSLRVLRSGGDVIRVHTGESVLLESEPCS